MTHNEDRIKGYSVRAINALEMIECPTDTFQFFLAIQELERLQTYLDLLASECPIPPRHQ